jgi:hypothetical protein
MADEQRESEKKAGAREAREERGARVWKRRPRSHEFSLFQIEI